MTDNVYGRALSNLLWGENNKDATSRHLVHGVWHEIIYQTTRRPGDLRQRDKHYKRFKEKMHDKIETLNPLEGSESEGSEPEGSESEGSESED
jgi:hypothetical protein